jgi:hypothetical protein
MLFNSRSKFITYIISGASHLLSATALFVTEQEDITDAVPKSAIFARWFLFVI